MARADDNSILNILRNHHTVLHNGCAILPSHHFCHRGCGVFTALPTLVTVAILVGVRWPFPEALICMSLRRREWLGASSHVSWFNLLRFFFTLFHCIWRSGSGEMFPLSSLARTAPALQTTAQVWKDSNTSGMERLTFWWSCSWVARLTQLSAVTHAFSTTMAALHAAGGRGEREGQSWEHRNRRLCL